MTAWWTTDGFVLGLKPDDWLLVRAGGSGRQEEVLASGTLEQVTDAARKRAVYPAVLVRVAEARTVEPG